MSSRTERESQPDSIYDREVILRNEGITLWYYPELKIVHHQMVKAPTSRQFRELLEAGADLVERHRAPKWLSDDRGNTVLRPDDEEWSETVWLPRVLGAGFRYWAIVLPEAAIGQLNMRRLATQHKQHGIVSTVETRLSKAFDWLKSQDTTAHPRTTLRAARRSRHES